MGRSTSVLDRWHSGRWLQIVNDADWEDRLANAWASVDDLSAEEFRAQIDRLAAELPSDSPVAAFEKGSAFDSTGRPDLAVPNYQLALERGLSGIRRRRAVIQLASSMRNLGQAAEAVALLRAERQVGSDELDDAVSAVLALALVDTGREREAAAILLAALAPRLPRYQRSMAAYARQLLEPDGG